MDHTYVEEHQIADRYVMGTLPADEAERFENHYLSCPECLDRLELAESVQRGFKRMAGQDVEKAAAVQQLAVVAWLARLGRMRQLGVLLAALLVVSMLPTGLALRNGSQLARAHSLLEQARQRTASSVGVLQAELERERAARTHAEEQTLQARGNDTVAFLGVERGEPEGGGPALHLPAGGWLILEVPVEPPFHSPYRAVLRNGKGQEVRRIEGLQPNERSNLSLSLPATLVPPGNYSITIEPGGQRLSFRVVP